VRKDRNPIRDGRPSCHRLPRAVGCIWWPEESCQLYSRLIARVCFFLDADVTQSLRFRLTFDLAPLVVMSEADFRNAHSLFGAHPLLPLRHK